MPVMSARVAAAALLLVTAGCDLGGEPDVPEPRFFASLAGALEAEYTGSGSFFVGSFPRRPAGVGPQLLTIQSDGLGASRGRQIVFTHRVPALPLPGVYPLGEQDGFTAYVTELTSRGTLRQSYAATGGELVVTTASADAIEGTFRFVGVATCTSTNGGATVVCDTSTDGADRARIEVTGHFTAKPGR